jgi:membrane protease YdiL (CAAX protease family)
MDSATANAVLADAAAWMVAALFIGLAAYRARAVMLGAAAVPDETRERGVVTAPYRGVDAFIVVSFAIVLAVGLRMGAAEMADALPEAVATESGETAAGGGADDEGESGNPLDMLGSVLFMLLMCAGLLFYLSQIRALEPARLFGLRRLGFRRVAAAAGAAMVVVLPVVLVVSHWSSGMLTEIWPDMEPQEAVDLFLNSDDPASRLILAVTAVVVAPLVEELIFRGFIYGVLKRFTDGIFAALATSALFAVAHFHLGSALPLMVLALGFTAAYERTGSLLVPMVMHAVFNTITLAVLTVYGAP